MYTNLVIPIVYEDKDVLVVLTEIDFVPEQRGTDFCEYLPEGLDILSGYVLDDRGKYMDFGEVMDEKGFMVSELALRIYKEELDEGK